MEETARWHEPLSLHPQDAGQINGYTPFTVTSYDLLSRIRSLLLSRNGHYPPKTPCPSPDLVLSPHDINYHTTENFDHSTGASKFDIDGTIAKLAQLAARSQAMVAKQNGGPAGLLQASTSEKRRRQSSQRTMESGRRSSNEDTLQQVDCDLEHKSFGHTIGRNLLSDSTIFAPSPKSPSSTRIPRYILRTVSPLTDSKAGYSVRPGPQHVPGSYRSEIDPALNSNYGTELSSADEEPSGHEKLHLETHPPKTATQALSDFQEHHSSTTDALSAQLGYLAPSLTHKTSNSTLQSNNTIRGGHHPLLQSSIDLFSLSKPAEPVFTPNLKHSHLHNGDQLATQLEHAMPLTNDLVDLEKHDHKSLTTNGIHYQNQLYQGSRRVSASSDEEVANLLAGHPPFSDDVMKRLKLEHTGYSSATAAPAGQLKPGNSSPSIYSRKSSLSFNEKVRSRKSSFSPTRSFQCAPKVSDKDTTDPLSGSLLDVDAQSTLSEQLSNLSRSISRLSDVSLRPLISSMRYEVAPDKDDSENEAVDLQKLSYLPSTKASRNTNESTDMVRLTGKSRTSGTKSYPRPTGTFLRSRVGSPDSIHHWVRQLLGKGSPVRAKSPTLTTRPSRKSKYIPLDSTGIHRTKTLPISTEFSAVVDGSRSQQRDTESTNTVMKQSNAESFSKLIVDLEVLLKEALSIARQAADKDEEGNVIADRDESGYNHTLPYLTAFDEDLKKTRLIQDESKHGRSRVAIVEPEGNQDQRQFTKPRDPTPYPPSSAIHTRHTSLAPTNGIINSTSEHAKELAAHLRLPEPESTIEFSSMEASQAQSESFAMGPISRKTATFPRLDDRMLSSSLRPYPQPLVEPPPQPPASTVLATKEQHNHLFRQKDPSKEEVRDYINIHFTPPIQPRTSSAKLRVGWVSEEGAYYHDIEAVNSSDEDVAGDTYLADFYQPGVRSRGRTRHWTGGELHARPGLGPGRLPKQDTITTLRAPRSLDNGPNKKEDTVENAKGYSLRDRHHFSIKGAQGFSLSRSHRRAPIARDWSDRRKRYVAAVACINTALIGVVIGIYAGEVPAIQYAIVDEHHYAILGNVVFFLGLAIPTILFFPLPLLHGRKPYTLAALGIMLPLLFPQAVAVGQNASPYVATYRVGLLLSRALAGFVAGFANINFKTTLLDLFGASLQSGNPHQETVNENDVRRHGGGMGVWLGIWTWCSIGSIGVGFLVGAGIIDGLPVTWGFWISIILTAAVLLLNVMSPEVRRSPYRRSMAEVNTGSEISRRIARGEVMMHLYSTGPKHWWQEVVAGHVLSIRMLKQPGFVILSLYMGWIYGQVVIVIVLLGALMSKYYMFHSQYVGLCVSAIPVGALLAVPFQKASLFSRARHHAPRTDSMTFEKRVTWTTHLVRRAIFMILLPFAGLAYTLASGGTQINFMVPTIFAAVIGFLSNLAIAECNGIIMETFDTSDLQPGMTGRPRRILPEDVRRKRTNFSCFPRVTAGFAITQTFAFCIAAAATGTGGVIERGIGAQAATGIMAGVLLILTLLLIAVLTRFKVVQIVPTQRYGSNVLGGPEDEWKPVIIGNPSGSTRRLSILEMGAMTRWSEIRRRNRLVEG